MLAEDGGHWKGVLYFDLEIHNIYFNKKGKYFVKLSINGSRGDPHQVKLYLNDQKNVVHDFEYTSEPCYQEDLDTPCQLDDTQFRFELPEEFSEGEVYLSFETYQFTKNPLVDPIKCGEGKFLVFPSAAPIPSEPSTSMDRETCYQFSTQITINRQLEDEQLFVNVAQAYITVLLQIQHQGHSCTRGSVMLRSAGVALPLSRNVILEEDEEQYVDEAQNRDAHFSFTEPSFDKNSLSSRHSSKRTSSNIDSRIGTHLPEKSSFMASESRNIPESHKITQTVNTPESEKDTLPQVLAPQQRGETALLEASNDQSNFLKAWTTSVERPSVAESQGSLSNWRSSQVEHLVGAVKVRDVPEREAHKRLSQQPEMSRNMSISSKSKQRKMIKDAPLPSSSRGPSTRHLCGSYLNDVGVYEAVVQVHSACDLPSNAQGRPPQPYVTGKVSDDEQGSGLSQCATHATHHPSYSPLWEELLVLKTPKEKFQSQELILSVADHPSKTSISTFRLPLQPLKPFYPYHLEMEQAGNEAKAKLFITILLKTDEVILPSPHSEIYGLEVVLRQFSSSLADNCSDPLVAVVRVVPSFPQYRERYLDGKTQEACIKTTKIKCPSPELVSKLSSVCGEDVYNVLQITFPGEPKQQPNWDQLFFFRGDDRSLFSLSSALVIEYFIASQVVSFGHWQPRSPIGYSFYNLDHSLLTALRRENASMGIRINNIAVRDCHLKSKTEEPVTVNIILRLITNKRPDPMLSLAHYNILPVIDVASTSSTLHEDGLDTTSDPVPDVSSVKRSSIPLPMINQHPTGGPVSVSAAAHRSNPTAAQPKINTGPDSTSLSIMEYQTKELEKHRYAMKKMADDIIQLKSEATRLQAANSRLRLELEHRSENNYQYPGLPAHLQNTTHTELVQRIVIIKGSLDEQTAINRELRLEVQSLQNQLIKKNEKERDFYKLQEAHKNQQVLLQKMQERLRRTKTLEETCKKQEKVIMRLEDFLANAKTKEKEMDKKSEEEQARTISEALSEENKRLRAQLLNYERTRQAVEDMDRLQVHDKLRRAEGRVAALEKELLDNTRRWARDKAELQLKLSETQLSQQSGTWQFPTLSQEPLGLFDRTPPDSGNYNRRSSPKLSPLGKK